MPRILAYILFVIVASMVTAFCTCWSVAIHYAIEHPSPRLLTRVFEDALPNPDDIHIDGVVFMTMTVLQFVFYTVVGFVLFGYNRVRQNYRTRPTSSSLAVYVVMSILALAAALWQVYVFFGTWSNILFTIPAAYFRINPTVQMAMIVLGVYLTYRTTRWLLSFMQDWALGVALPVAPPPPPPEPPERRQERERTHRDPY